MLSLYKNCSPVPTWGYWAAVALVGSNRPHSTALVWIVWIFNTNDCYSCGRHEIIGHWNYFGCHEKSITFLRDKQEGNAIYCDSLLNKNKINQKFEDGLIEL